MAFYTKLDQVADILREKILTGELERGEKLRQAEIAFELGVSVTPVREALKALEMEGYVASEPHKGLCVTKLASEEFQEIYDLRLMMELDLTRRAVEHISVVGYESLVSAQMEFAKFAAQGDVFGARASNVRFHFKLYGLADRPQTLKFIRLLWAKYPFNYSKEQEERLLQISNEHELFLTHIRERNVEAAVSAMADHIASGGRRVQSFLSK